MSVSEHAAKGEQEETGEERTNLERLCDTLHHTHWNSLTMKALFRGIETAEKARMFARAEAHRKERYGVEPRKHVVAKLNELALELDEDGGSDE